MHPFVKLLALSLLLLPAQALAQDGRLTFGGDQFTAGQSAQVNTAVARDLFAAGYDVAVHAPVSGDAHLAGFNVGQGAELIEPPVQVRRGSRVTAAPALVTIPVAAGRFAPPYLP